jgi:hypothetical protein
MATPHRRHRNPNWPPQVHTTFTPAGLAVLDKTYDYLKGPSGLERASRISAEDLAASIEAMLRATGNTHLLR